MASGTAACLIYLCIKRPAPQDDDEEHWSDLAKSRLAKTGAVILLTGFVGLTLLTPFCSRNAVRRGAGEHADQAARELLQAMQGRTCLITNGLIDNHIRVQAHVARQPLMLITLRTQPIPHETHALQQLIVTSPIFEGLNRQRLLNALSTDITHFVMEWLSTSPRAGRDTMIFAVPDLWIACGYRPVPEGLAFSGVRPDEAVDLAALDAQSRALCEQLRPVLAAQKDTFWMAESLRTALRRKTAFATNELGVLLEDNEKADAAFAAYTRACEIDPLNLSAALNAEALNLRQKLHPDKDEVLVKRIKTIAASVPLRTSQDIAWVLQNCGTIRQRDLYRAQAVFWSSRGSTAVEAEKLKRAHALEGQTGVEALLSNADIYLKIGETTKAENCYLAALESEPENPVALGGMCTLALSRKQPEEAEMWLQKAQTVSPATEALRFQAISVALMKGESDRVFKLLQSAVKEVPTDTRYWMLLADVMLERGDAQQVERELLPMMKAALKSDDHPGFHIIRGITLRKRGPRFYAEARAALLKALSYDAQLPDVWRALLEVDCLIGTPEIIESDARKLLLIEPDHALANYLVGKQLLERRNLPEAEDFLLRSIEKRPTAMAHADLAECLRLQKKFADAEAAARAALQIEPEAPALRNALAIILCDMQRFGEAETLAAQNVAAAPAVMPFHLTLLRAEIGLGKKDAADARMKRLSAAEFPVPEDIWRAVIEME